jgi:UDP-glucose 4-epimerase
VVGRLFNTVGPRQTGRYGMVIPSFVRQALADQPLTVYGTGSQRRCFCHVGDVVRALVGLMQTEEAHGQVFNIGSQEEIAIAELARDVIEATGSSSEAVLVSYDEAYAPGFEDMERRIPDTSKIHGLLGWAPDRRLHEILDEVIAYHRAPPSVAGNGQAERAPSLAPADV